MVEETSFLSKAYVKINEYVDNTLTLAGYSCPKIRAPKLIRCNIFGFGIFYQHEINLIDSPFLQRLRGIFQTSLALYTYPGATHTRFEHSLGCLINAEKMMSALKDRGATIQNNQTAEIRMAALLHDIGHGPFSHASEKVYNLFDELSGFFEDLQNETPDLFGGCAPHEILGYLIITSQQFRNFFQNKIAIHYATDYRFNLSSINLENVGRMILGRPPANDKSLKFLSQIINGPFDVDTIDYLHRDGHETGLKTEIDVDRLFLTLNTVLNNDHERVLSVDLSGATVLEQLLFNKSVLFTSVYHHHKIRASLCSIKSLFKLIKDNSYKINGRDLSHPIHFLEIDEYDILNTQHVEGDKENELMNKYILDLKNRKLLKRALVIAPISSASEESSLNIFKLAENKSKIAQLEEEISDSIPELKNGPKMIYLDFPERPRFGRTAIESLVRISDESLVPLENLYPIRGWVTGYSQFRYKAYVFCPSGFEDKIGKTALELLHREGITINKYGLEMANQEPRIVHELFPPAI